MKLSISSPSFNLYFSSFTSILQSVYFFTVLGFLGVRRSGRLVETHDSAQSTYWSRAHFHRSFTFSCGCQNVALPIRLATPPRARCLHRLVELSDRYEFVLFNSLHPIIAKLAQVYRFWCRGIEYPEPFCVERPQNLKRNILVILCIHARTHARKDMCLSTYTRTHDYGHVQHWSPSIAFR